MLARSSLGISYSAWVGDTAAAWFYVHVRIANGDRRQGYR